VRQFFLPGLDLERPLLGAAAGLAAGSLGLASYNGRTFDVPLIETRFLFHRLAEPFTALAHLDLLHPARRLWWREEGCRLTTLERRLLGVDRGEDVSGFEIPERYFTYLRNGDAAIVEPVLDHNRTDLLTLAGLTMRLAWLYETGPEASRDGAECFGLGSLFERTGQAERALASYERAASLARHFEDELRLDAWHRRALLLRRLRRHGDALAAWETIAAATQGASASARRDALRALAVHHEHRSKDLASAREFAAESLQAERGSGVASARHRLARLDRKLETPGRANLPAGASPLARLLDPGWS
jgi:tetratricopeptide (TPR) repeat protein